MNTITAILSPVDRRSFHFEKLKKKKIKKLLFGLCVALCNLTIAFCTVLMFR